MSGNPNNQNPYAPPSGQNPYAPPPGAPTQGAPTPTNPPPHQYQQHGQQYPSQPYPPSAQPPQYGAPQYAQPATQPPSNPYAPQQPNPYSAPYQSNPAAPNTSSNPYSQPHQHQPNPYSAPSQPYPTSQTNANPYSAPPQSQHGYNAGPAPTGYPGAAPPSGYPTATGHQGYPGGSGTDPHHAGQAPAAYGAEPPPSGYPGADAPTGYPSGSAPGAHQGGGPPPAGYPGGAPPISGYPGAPSVSAPPGGSGPGGYPGGAPTSGYPGAPGASGPPGGSATGGYPGGAPTSGYPAAPGASAPSGGSAAGAPPAGYPGGAPTSGYPGAPSASASPAYTGGSAPGGYPGGPAHAGYPGASPPAGYGGASAPAGYAGASAPSGYPGVSAPGGYPGGPAQGGYPSGAASGHGPPGMAAGGLSATYVDTPAQPLIAHGAGHGGGRPVPKLDLVISCRDLKDRDLAGKSDPFVRVGVRFAGEQSWHKVGETEVKENELNPHFVTPVTIEYYFEQVQEVRFDVIDCDKKIDVLGKRFGQSLGSFETQLASILGCGSNWIEGSLVKGGKAMIRVVAHDHERNKEAMEFAFQGIKLKSRDGMFSKSDAYLRLIALEGSGTRQSVAAQTEYIKDNSSPVWKPLVVSINRLCGHDYNRQVKIECLDYDNGSQDDLIGEVTTSLAELMSPSMFRRDLQLPSKPKSQGIISLQRPPVKTQVVEFVDFLQGGLEVELMVAIDFTASNGNPQQPNSLHYNHPDPRHQNPYETAIRAVGGVLAPYDSTRSFPVFGFGGVLPGHGSVSHCFALNGNEANPHVSGVEGLLQAYNLGLQHVRLSGPTHFAPVVRRAASIAGEPSQRGGMKYSVLLLITDGAILDMAETVAAIGAAAESVPLSIVIVGVGQADFAAMHQLDGDHSKKSFSRDVVQFVEFAKFSGHGSGPKLAATTLVEIPGQVVSHFQKKGIKPGLKALQASSAAFRIG